MAVTTSSATTAPAPQSVGGGQTLPPPPTPTQEENDKLATGQMHPDDKAQAPTDKAAPTTSGTTSGTAA